MGERVSNEELGSKSIFYDPEWNPKGVAPPGFRNVAYNPTTFTRKQGSLQRHALGINIDLPKEEDKNKYNERE